MTTSSDSIRIVSDALTYASYGKPIEVLKLTQQAVDSPKDDQVVIKMLAAPIHPADLLTVMGAYPDKPTFPAIAGNEGVGEVIECGSKVTSLKVGDHVLPFGSKRGTWQTYMCRGATDCILLDKRLSIEVAAVLFVNPGTAYRILLDFVKLKSGDVIIQNGATSAVGFYIMQMSKNMGIKTINLFRERDSKEATEATRSELLAHGATWAVTDVELADENNKYAADIRANATPKLAVDCLGGEPTHTILQFLRPGGTLVTYGAMTGKPMSIRATDLIFKDIHIHGFWLMNWMRLSSIEDRVNMFAQFTEWFIQGKLKTSPFVRVPFKDWLKAIEMSKHSKLQPTSIKGKAILFMN